MYHIGFPDPVTGTVINFSPYLVLERSSPDRLNSASGGSGSPPPSPAPMQNVSCQVTYVSLAYACKAVVYCIKMEKGNQPIFRTLKEKKCQFCDSFIFQIGQFYK